MGAAEEIADFAALLRELKQRSGLSYEALAKRAHMSTSTLHRYCKGEGVPADYAAVSRFGRVCKATPEELVELHRRWVLADAARERARRAAADSEPDTAPPPAPAQPTASATAPTSMSEPGGPPGSVAEPSPEAVVLARRTPTLIRTTRRRWALIAASTAVVVAVSTALTVDLKGGGTDLAENGRPADTVTSSGQPASTASTLHPSASMSPSARPSRSPAPTPRAPDAKPSVHSTDTGRAQDSDEVPLTVSTRTYAWDDPQCEAKYLINRPPDEVSPPVMGQDVPGWVKAHGAIAADRQRVALTVQGTGDETVVIESMHVRVVNSSTPPAWNAYLGSSGCGGGVETRSFDTDLDAGHPTTVPKAGQRGLPYKVSQSDPEVLYITAHASAHDVKWWVELQWSSGGRQGTTRIDDHGIPFRTSGSRGRPVYEHLVGGTEWFSVAEN
ncbi:Helix-turn-helix domain-containing protein [Streptomyces sp. OV198]|uniref:helix-turn-helix domain-containing protein n=1 Tax=Streptomyces sp. OV198 TaxID=1882787 RepID=UPI000BCD2E34|nr:helix-turn-helix transcriptional regulator [Streptomyces sp. OV198]SOE71462.1 Helix-turn-helix domain-containing protein [Streptomyces sp. OV198]